LIRQALVGQVLRLVGGADTPAERHRQDVGLFGRDSAAWTVHGDFTSMMVSGNSAAAVDASSRRAGRGPTTIKFRIGR